MRLGRIRIAKASRLARHKLLIWATLISVLCGIIKFGEPLDNVLRIARNKLHSHEASGQIVVIGIDQESARKLGSWPWPRRHHAQLTDRLRDLGAKRIVFDVGFYEHSDPANDRLFEAALARSKGKVVLPTRFEIDPVTQERVDLAPIPEFRKHARQANINFWVDGFGSVWRLPYAMRTNGEDHPSVSAMLAGIEGESGATFPLDFTIDIRSIPVVSAGDLIGGKVQRSMIEGRDVIIGTTSDKFDDNFAMPGEKLTPGVIFHVVGAETLKRGRPLDLGWITPFLVAFLVVAVRPLSGRRPLPVPVLAIALSCMAVVPLFLESWLIFVDVAPAMLLLAIVAGGRAWAGFKRKSATTNPLSGLPNLNALRQQDLARDTALVAARIRNFAEITSALPRDMERVLAGQIANRIALGSDHVTVYQGDEGIFAWLVPTCPSSSIGDQLDALHVLFRSPVVVEGRQVDLSATFGVDMGGERLIANRLGSALVAADEAASEGRKWKAYDAARLEDAEWKLSLLGRLDAAIDCGEIWVAYQPKLDLATKRVCGAEALVRWTHPEKGDISPEDFVLAAEQHNRIEKLTTFVLNEAIGVAAAINALGIEFDVAVNLSPRLLDNPDLVGVVSGLLSRHGLAPEHLTLEVTESVAMTSDSRAIELLEKLRFLGLGISIDDYGTGFSTLDYLKKIPASEIKIDKSFIDTMDMNQSDKLLVNSTIGLAHSLGRKVVAEGVERAETLRSLEAMGCDLAQGFLIGRPMAFQLLRKWLFTDQVQMVA